MKLKALALFLLVWTATASAAKKVQIVINNDNNQTIDIDITLAEYANLLVPMLATKTTFVLNNRDLDATIVKQLFDFIELKNKGKLEAIDIYSAYQTFTDMTHFTDIMDYFDVPLLEEDLAWAWIILVKILSDDDDQRSIIKKFTYKRLYEKICSLVKE